jgi:ATP-dependent exoDNAse (exonuclease V) beta subunit
MEYDVVQIVNDFVSEELLIKQKENNKEENNYSPAQINEEINLLYVAITRTRNRVYVPKTLMPTEHPHSPKILVMKPISKEIDNMQATTNMPNGTEYKYLEKVYDISLNEAALKYSQTQQYWTDKLDKQLMLMYNDGITLNDIANHFGRTVEEIKGRVKELGI